MLNRLRNFLRPPERKASRTARLIAIESGGRARWTPRDYAALAREGYHCNAIVHRAVRLIAESVGALSFVLYEGAAELTAHPLLDLLARPNPRQDGASLLEAVSSHLLLAGNAYVEAVAIDGQGNDQANPNVRELYALRPDRMKVVPGPDGWPQAYEYTVNGATVRFEQSAALPPILQLTLFNPLDDYYGLSPLEAAAKDVFEKAKTGPLYDVRSNKWDQDHRAYNEAVGETLDDYLKKAGTPPEKMTADQAREFLGKIFESPDPRIKNYNMGIQMREIMQRLLRRGGRE